MITQPWWPKEKKRLVRITFTALVGLMVAIVFSVCALIT